jgi:hypothetical protein
MKDKFGTEIPLEVENLAKQFIGRKVLIVGDHPHADKTGTVDRVECARAIGKWGFVVELEDGQSCFVFSGKEWRVLG